MHSKNEIWKQEVKSGTSFWRYQSHWSLSDSVSCDCSFLFDAKISRKISHTKMFIYIGEWRITEWKRCYRIKHVVACSRKMWYISKTAATDKQTKKIESCLKRYIWVPLFEGTETSNFKTSLRFTLKLPQSAFKLSGFTSLSRRFRFEAFNIEYKKDI